MGSRSRHPAWRDSPKAMAASHCGRPRRPAVRQAACLVVHWLESRSTAPERASMGRRITEFNRAEHGAIAGVERVNRRRSSPAATWARFDLSTHSLEHQAPAPESGSGARAASSSAAAPSGPNSTAIQWVPGRESSALLIIMVNGTEMNMPIGPSTQLQNTGDRNTTGADKSTPRPTRVLGGRAQRRSAPRRATSSLGSVRAAWGMEHGEPQFVTKTSSGSSGRRTERSRRCCG